MKLESFSAIVLDEGTSHVRVAVRRQSRLISGGALTVDEREKALDIARQCIARFNRCDPRTIVFRSRVTRHSYISFTVSAHRVILSDGTVDMSGFNYNVHIGI